MNLSLSGTVRIFAWMSTAALILATDLQVPSYLAALLCFLLAVDAYGDERRWQAEMRRPDR